MFANEWGQIGLHVHMCPNCFEYINCEMDCSWFEDEGRMKDGRPMCHPVECDKCTEKRLIIVGWDPILMGA